MGKQLHETVKRMEETIVALQPLPKEAPTPQELSEQSVLDENSQRILLLEEEIRKQQAYAQSEMRGLHTTIEELQARLASTDAAARERDHYRQELDALRAQMATESTLVERKTEELDRLYTEKIEQLQQELMHQQQYSAQESEALRQQIAELQAREASLVAGTLPPEMDRDLQELAQMNVEAKARLQELTEENYALRNDNQAADERVRPVTAVATAAA